MTHLIRLRAPSIDDARTLALLSGELGYEAAPDVMSARIATLLQRQDHHLAIAAVDDEVAGWIQAHVNTSLESGFRAEIIGLVVGARFRRKGIARMLVADAITWSKHRGADALVVRSNVVRTESHQFYPSVGFELVKNQAVYRMVL